MGASGTVVAVIRSKVLAGLMKLATSFFHEVFRMVSSRGVPSLRARYGFADL